MGALGARLVLTGLRSQAVPFFLSQKKAEADQIIALQWRLYEDAQASRRHGRGVALLCLLAGSVGVAPNALDARYLRKIAAVFYLSLI